MGEHNELHTNKRSRPLAVTPLHGLNKSVDGLRELLASRE